MMFILLEAASSVPFKFEIGILGSILFVGGFASLNFGLLTSKSYIYQFANLIGAICFTYTAFGPFNPGFFITEAAWAAIGVYGIWKIVKGKKEEVPVPEAPIPPQ